MDAPTPLIAQFITDTVAVRLLGSDSMIGNHTIVAVVIKIPRAVPRKIGVQAARAMPVLGIVIRAVVWRDGWGDVVIAVARHETGRLSGRADGWITRRTHRRVHGRTNRRIATGLQLGQGQK